MLDIYKQTKIYIACPAGMVSGGAELLHQLCYILINDLKLEAYMYYYPNNLDNPIYSDYKFYNNPWVKNICDNQADVIVVPEIESALCLLKKLEKTQKAVWFLGLDCYFSSKLKKNKFFLKRAINKILKLSGKYPIFEIGFENINIENFPPEKDPLLKDIDLIMTNSYRNIDFLRSRGLKPVYLSEYLSEDFLKIQTDLSKKENVVAYNPRKGFSFTKKIIKSGTDIKFVPIINMNRKEVVETLQKSKLYIDFGNHSGKDRIPREAAILGCCVITGKRGSAAFYDDVSIPDKYKFDDVDKNIPKIIESIKDCLKNYEKKVVDFYFYKSVIKNEKSKFVEDAKYIFSRKVIKYEK